MRVATRRLRAALEVFEPCFPRPAPSAGAGRGQTARRRARRAPGPRRPDRVAGGLRRRPRGRRASRQSSASSHALRTEQATANDALAELLEDVGDELTSASELAARAVHALARSARRRAACRAGARDRRRSALRWRRRGPAVRGLDPEAPLAANARRIVRVRVEELYSFAPQALEESGGQGAARHAHRREAAALRARAHELLLRPLRGEGRASRARAAGPDRRDPRLRRAEPRVRSYIGELRSADAHALSEAALRDGGEPTRDAARAARPPTARSRRSRSTSRRAARSSSRSSASAGSARARRLPRAAARRAGGRARRERNGPERTAKRGAWLASGEHGGERRRLRRRRVCFYESDDGSARQPGTLDVPDELLDARAAHAGQPSELRRERSVGVPRSAIPRSTSTASSRGSSSTSACSNSPKTRPCRCSSACASARSTPRTSMSSTWCAWPASTTRSRPGSSIRARTGAPPRRRSPRSASACSSSPTGCARASRSSCARHSPSMACASSGSSDLDDDQRAYLAEHFQPGHLPGAHAAGGGTRAALPLHLEPLAQPRRARARPGLRASASSRA